MARTVASLSVSINAATKGLRKGLARANKEIQTFGDSARKTLSGLAKFGAAAGAAAFGIGALNVKKQFASLDNLAKTSARLNVLPNNLIALRDAAQLSGTTVETLDMGLQKMVRRVSEAADGTGEAVKALKELGIDAAALEKLETGEAFEKVAKAMVKVNGETDQVRLTMKLFDTGGVKLLNTLRDVADKGLGSFVDRVKETGRAVTQDQLKPVEDMNDAFTKLGQRWTGLFSTLAVALASPIEQALTSFDRFLQNKENIEGLRDAFKDLLEAIRELPETFERLNKSYEGFKTQITGKGTTAISNIARTLKAGGQLLGGMGSAAAANFREGDQMGATGAQIMSDASSEALKTFEPVRQAIWDYAVEIGDGVIGGFKDLQRWVEANIDPINANIDKAINGSLGQRQGGIVDTLTRNGKPIPFSSALGQAGALGGLGSLNAPMQVQDMEANKKLDELKRSVGFGTNPNALPKGVMLIRVEG